MTITVLIGKLFLLIGLISVVTGVFYIPWLWYAKRAKHSQWNPALKNVHDLGSTYPQDSRGPYIGIVNAPYTVPKDPIEYAKIFVPETKEKGQSR